MNQHHFNTEQIPIFKQAFEECSDYINNKHEPFILRGIELGSCMQKWTPEFLAKHVDVSGCEVKIHISQSPNLDFLKKNFAYKSLPFPELIQRASQIIHTDFFISNDEFYYLRSLGQDPRRDVADIQMQFPTLAQDIIFPDLIPPEKIFSSVFRIASAGLTLWTHYDVMDNMLIQIRGRKRAVLFPPSDALNMYLNGDKSEVLDIDNPDLEKYPKFKDTQRRECHLEPGDILYIPALWFHNMKYLEFGIAINIFWKELDTALYDKKDPYGNKDPMPAQQALASVDRAIGTLSKLPSHYKQFYCRRLIARIHRELGVPD